MRVFLIFLIFINICFAELDDFLDDLEEVTDIATKTKLNIDYVPGTVNIIYGEELKSMGVTNLNQQNAYDMIIGMESVVSSLRGVGSMYGSNGNKIKWMINDRVIENELRETSVWAKGNVFIPIPVEFIDRVEFIRGPGSALYGGNAIFGVINIITKKGESGSLLGFESFGDGHRAQHFGVYKNIILDDLYMDILLSGYRSDGYSLYVDESGHFYSSFSGQKTVGSGPGYLPTQNLGYSLMLDIDFKDYKFWLYLFNTKEGQGFSSWYPTEALPPDNGKYMKESLSSMVGIEKNFEVGNFKVKPSMGVSFYDTPMSKFQLVPADERYGFTTDKFLSRKYREQKSFLSVDLEKKFKKHTFNLGLFLQHTEVLKDNNYRNFDLKTYTEGKEDITNWYEHKPLLKSRKSRIQKAIYLQHIIDIVDNLTLTSGVRYDYFSDLGNSAISPRLALVYQLDDSNILKTQYSKAFRPPSLFQAYGYMSPYVLKPEVVDTIEFSYIYKNLNHTVKTTVFDSKMKNMIIQHYDSYYFENLENLATVKGVELEYEFKLKDFLFGLNGAVYDSDNRETGKNFSLTSKFMGNVWLKYLIDSEHPFTLWYHYLSPKQRTENSSNGYIPAGEYLNLSQKIVDFIPNLDLDFGVRNLFNKTIETLYMPLNARPIGVGHNNDDIPYMNRSFWFNLSYKF